MRTNFFIAISLSVILTALYSCGGEDSGDPKDEKNAETSAPSTAEETVKSFIKYLGAKDFESAFNLQKNESWGSFEKFKSKESFGGIVKTEILNIETKPDADGCAVVYVEAVYEDAENGDNTFKQNYYLKKYGGEWKIYNMKLAKNSKSASNWSDSFEELKNAITNGDKSKVKTFFDFPIQDEQNLIWYKAYGFSEDIDIPTDRAKPFPEKEFDKNYDKIFPKEFKVLIARVNTQELLKMGEFSTTEYKVKDDSYAMHVFFDKKENILWLGLNVTFLSDGEEYGHSDVYSFNIVSDKMLKFKGIEMVD